MKYSKKDIIRLIEEEDVEFIRLQFTDIFGMLKNVAITASQLNRALDNRCIFDGSAIEGFVRVEESDMCLHPDLDTFGIFPWRPQQGKVARFMCDVYDMDGKPFVGDPRNVLKSVLARAKELGFGFKVGPECEFFLFHMDEDGNPTTKTHEIAGYFDVSPVDHGENVRRDIILNLEEMDFVVEASHHELSPGQHEIDIQQEDALKAADNLMTFHMTVKAIAKRHGMHATFMPKPRAGINGSATHLNLYLAGPDGKSLLNDGTDKYGLSAVAYQFMAGILDHINEMALVTNPLVNSYKRLVPGYEAPIYIAWSATANRSPLIRIPRVRGEDTHIELRNPDSAINPYLTLAVCLAAGLDGINRQLQPPANVEANICEMSEKERKSLGIEQLPSTMGEALDAFAKSSFMKEVLGEHIFNKYLEAKRREWESFLAIITDWEVEEYLYRH